MAANNDELACTYSALILADDDVPITSEKITTILKSANVQFEPIWPTLFARALTGVNIKDLVTKIGSAAAAAPAAAPAAAAKKDEKKEEKKKVVQEESDKEDDDLGFGLFD